MPRISVRIEERASKVWITNWSTAFVAKFSLMRLWTESCWPSFRSIENDQKSSKERQWSGWSYYSCGCNHQDDPLVWELAMVRIWWPNIRVRWTSCKVCNLKLIFENIFGLQKLWVFKTENYCLRSLIDSSWSLSIPPDLEGNWNQEMAQINVLDSVSLLNFRTSKLETL